MKGKNSRREMHSVEYNFVKRGAKLSPTRVSPAVGEQCRTSPGNIRDLVHLVT